MTEPAIAGETYKMPNGTRVEALPSCKSNNGSWICLTHGQAFENQLQKDLHIAGRNKEDKHTLGWICLEHGLEQP